MAETGKCLCGAVTFSAEDVQHDFHACHCGMCRKWSGGPGMGVSVGKVTFDGAENITAYASSEWAERAFCKQCGTNLYYRMPEQDMYILWAGAFDDQTPFEMHGEIYIDEKPAGYNFAGEHPRQTGQEFLASIGVPDQ